MEKVELIKCPIIESEDSNSINKDLNSIDTKYPWITKDVS